MNAPVTPPAGPKPVKRNLVPLVTSTLSVVRWLQHTANLENQGLLPTKLQRLLYLAQAHYVSMHSGRKLMPATFLATEGGPVETTIYAMLEAGAAPPSVRRPGEEAETFLDVVWRKYGHHSPDHLLRLISRDEAFFDALEMGPFTEITIKAMFDFYVVPERRLTMPPKLAQNGKPMANWTPRSADEASRNPRRTRPDEKGPELGDKLKWGWA